jgi:hypothetical protein
LAVVETLRAGRGALGYGLGCCRFAVDNYQVLKRQRVFVLHPVAGLPFENAYATASVERDLIAPVNDRITVGLELESGGHADSRRFGAAVEGDNACFCYGRRERGVGTTVGRARAHDRRWIGDGRGLRLGRQRLRTVSIRVTGRRKRAACARLCCTVTTVAGAYGGGATCALRGDFPVGACHIACPGVGRFGVGRSGAGVGLRFTVTTVAGANRGGAARATRGDLPVGAGRWPSHASAGLRHSVAAITGAYCRGATSAARGNLSVRACRRSRTLPLGAALLVGAGVRQSDNREHGDDS